MDPILTLHLEDIGVSEDNAGLGFALMAFAFIPGAGLFGPLAEKSGRRVIIAISNIFIGVALWLTGGLRINSSVVTWIGIGLNGFFIAGPCILTMPEILESME